MKHSDVMEKLNEIIGDYLQAKDTDYALMINGEWGCGKTFYLNHDFKEFVTAQKCPNKPDGLGQAKKNLTEVVDGDQRDYFYAPAFVSLYGISSPEDFQYRVFLGVNTWANNKLVGLMANIGSKAASLFGINLEKRDTDNLTVISNNTILVFDDLERISSDKINVKEVLGLINEYSEHKHYKVIIVCNENVYDGKIEGIERDKDYWRYKEKTIRYTYQFEADMPSVFDTLCDTYDNEKFKEYLAKMKQLILTLFSLGGNKNLRTMKFYLDSMSKIYDSVPDVKYKDTILRTLCVSTLIYATQYKDGHEREQLCELKAKYDIDFGDNMFGFSKDEKKDEKQESITESIAEIFGDYYRNEMACIPCIVDYLITGYLDKDLLSEWVKESNAEYLRTEDKPEFKLYRELSSFATVDDGSLVEKLGQMIQYARDGKYKVIDLMQVYALLVKYHCFHIEGFTLTEEIENDFIKAIDAYKDTWKYFPELEYKIPMWDSREKGQESFDKYDVLKTHLLQMNYQSRIADEKADYSEFIEKAERGDVKGIRYYRESQENRISLSGIDWSKVCSILDKGGNPIACEVAMCIQFLIPDISFVHPNDMDSLKSGLKKWLDEYMDRGDNRVRRLYITELKRHIDSIVRCF